jgi:hypothetical protein
MKHVKAENNGVCKNGNLGCQKGNSLTKPQNKKKIYPAGKTEAGNAGEQPARDSRSRFRRNVALGMEIYLYPQPLMIFRRFLPCLKKTLTCRMLVTTLNLQVISPFHAEPVQWPMPISI